MSEEAGPALFAWCDQATRVDAFAATLATLVDSHGLCSITINSLGRRDHDWRHDISVDEAVTMMRGGFTASAYTHTSVTVTLRPGSWIWPIFYCNGDEYEHRSPFGPLQISLGDRKDVFPRSLIIAFGQGERDLSAEAAIVAMQGQEDVERLLTRLCAPDASTRVVTGAYTDSWFWGAPIEACATYHADAEAVARDLALSWIYLHDGNRLEHIAGTPMDALRARVDVAPAGAHVAVALTPARVLEHVALERADRRAKHIPHGRVAVSGDVALSREAVLRALTMPPGALLEALEASALPDDEWRTAEGLALEAIEAAKAGAPTHEVDVTTRKHVRFIEQHAPYHVRRLPNGGVILATHPYRTLWQLYADALFLLGIDPS
ncbi:MAG: hypothetical protein ABI193_23645 [Minicystis sp.]